MKKFVLVLSLGLFTLTGCGNLQSKGKEISYKEAIEKLNTAEVDTTAQNKFGVSYKIDKMMFNYLDETIVDLTDLKANVALENLSTQEDKVELSGSADFSLKSFSLTTGTSKNEFKDIAASAYIDDSKAYVDLSSKGLKTLLTFAGITDITDDKFYVEIPSMDVPTTTPDTDPSQDMSIEDIIQQIDPTINPDEILTQINEVMESISPVFFKAVKAYTKDDYKDFTFEINITKDIIVELVDTLTSTDLPVKPADKNNEIPTVGSIIDKALTEGGFKHIKATIKIDDYQLTKVAVDINFGINDIFTSLDDSDSESKIIKAEFKSSLDFTYGDKVEIKHLDDYSEFVKMDTTNIAVPSTYLAK